MSQATHISRNQATPSALSQHFHSGCAGVLLIALAAFASPSQAAVDYPDAERMVKNQICKVGETVDQFLDRKLKPSHRDLGWRVFARDDGFDVERSFMASKSMELRYRWRVSGAGNAQATSERAKQLCS